MRISAFLPVYNEEKRIDSALTSLQWCDEIILLDKYSTDRTVEIARRYGEKVKIFFMNNSETYDANEWNFLFDQCSGEWIIRFTASDIMHPELALSIQTLINNDSFNYDIIEIPFRRYVLGLQSKYSPWHSNVCPMVFRKSALYLDKHDVHHALKFKGTTYTMKGHDVYCMHHLTHETVDIMMERHLRYLRGESRGFESDELRKPFISVILETLKVFFYRRSFVLGWDGIMLGFAYITYHMMSFVYKWERKRNNAAEVYRVLRENSIEDWNKNSLNKVNISENNYYE
ncbi:Glycosyltransferase involved in cell wall bisynthesis [Solitalea koreensis]|uniref:Glycosyltransferase involved in cell wall bisynthesis n=2 Tax=Solitalea koreensis TaxID=543615 RepID=A0A521CRV1_9SPHI|nr:Glycosyltransferase involved in cell wall bisynthesis [Solitalea koreensis]